MTWLLAAPWEGRARPAVSRSGAASLYIRRELEMCCVWTCWSGPHTDQLNQRQQSNKGIWCLWTSWSVTTADRKSKHRTSSTCLYILRYPLCMWQGKRGNNHQANGGAKSWCTVHSHLQSNFCLCYPGMHTSTLLAPLPIKCPSAMPLFSACPENAALHGAAASAYVGSGV